MGRVLDFEAIRTSEPTLPDRGAMVGEYEILEPIGEGGYSVVYRAYHARLDRDVALKIVRPSAAAARSGLNERFLHEIDLVARLEHPNIVRLYDFGESESGLLWMATEVIRGRELTDILSEGGPMSPSRARGVALQALSGLVLAHEHGIIHCDLKPDNIMLTRKGANADWVQLLDFGIARVVTGDAAGGLVESAGTIQGTPRYMAPEQFRHEPIGPQTDVYAMGLVLYELLVGRPAIGGEGLEEIIRQVMRQALWFPEELEGSELAAVIRQATAPDPARRFASVMAFYQAVESCDVEPSSVDVDLGEDEPAPVIQLIAPPAPPAALTPPLSAPPSSWERSSSGRWAVVSGLVVLGVVVGVVLAWTFSGAWGEGPPADRPLVVEPPESAPPVLVEPGSREIEEPTSVAAPPAEGATEVDWALVSQPPGARVLRGEAELCARTPCRVTLPRSDAPLEVTFELRGYATETTAFQPDQHGRLLVSLRRRGSNPGSSAPTTSVEEPVPRRGGPDPFKVPHH